MPAVRGRLAERPLMRALQKPVAPPAVPRSTRLWVATPPRPTPITPDHDPFVAALDRAVERAIWMLLAFAIVAFPLRLAASAILGALQ